MSELTHYPFDTRDRTPSPEPPPRQEGMTREQVRRLQQARKWTRERPTAAGWYWWRRRGRLSIVSIVWEPLASDGTGYFEVRGDNLLWSLDSLDGEFQGPLTPGEE